MKLASALACILPLDPLQLSAFFNDAGLSIQFARCHNDLRATLDEVRNFRKTTRQSN